MRFIKILVAACLLFLGSCTIPVTGNKAVAETAATVQVGKTTLVELTARLGEPAPLEMSRGRHVANWSNAAVGMSGASFIGTNHAIFESLGVECDARGVVRRKVSHVSREEHSLATGFQAPPVERVVRNPGPFLRMTSGRQLEAELGAPQFKQITFAGERWIWVAMHASGGKSVLFAELDRNGRIRGLKVK